MTETYTSLQANIADWLIRQDLGNVIPSFIRLAEADMARKLKTRFAEAYTRLDTTNGQATLPDDFMGIRNIELLGKAMPLTYAPADFFDGADERSGDAMYYTIQGEALLFYPKPPEDTTVEIRYRTRIPALSDENPSNWLLEQHFDAYLYGALIHSAGYLDDDTRMPMWVSLYSAAIRSINENDIDESLGSTLQMVSAEGNPY